MIIDKSKFESKELLVKYIVENKKDIIAIKKSVVKYCDVIDYKTKPDDSAFKSFEYQNEDDLKAGIIKRAIVGNTYGWFDSHDDVHIEGIFTKTLQENKKNVLHLHDHIQQLAAKVGVFTDVIEQRISWIELGKQIQGETISLIGISSIKKSYNASIYDQYLNNEINQHSVGMMYVNLFLCVNNPEYKEEFANWQKYIPKVANVADVIENGYFWAVTEAKLKEISAVIAGSNEVTPTLQPQKSTEEPQESTHKEDKSTEFDWEKSFKLIKS